MSFVATQIDLDIIVLSKSDSKRSYIAYMWNVKKKMIQMNLYTEQKQSHRHKLMVTKGERRGEINYEFEINVSILLYIKQIANNDLLHSRENHTQYFIIT